MTMISPTKLPIVATPLVHIKIRIDSIVKKISTLLLEIFNGLDLDI